MTLDIPGATNCRIIILLMLVVSNLSTCVVIPVVGLCRNAASNLVPVVLVRLLLQSEECMVYAVLGRSARNVDNCELR